MAPHFYIDSESDGDYEEIIEEGSLSSASSLDSLDNWDLLPQYSSTTSHIIVDIENPVTMSPLQLTSSHDIPRENVIKQLQKNLMALSLELFYQSFELDSSRALVAALRQVLRIQWPPTILALEYKPSVTPPSEPRLTNELPEASLSLPQ